MNRKSVAVAAFTHTCFAAGMIGVGYGLAVGSFWLAGLFLLGFGGGVTWGNTGFMILRGVSFDRTLRVLAVATILMVVIEILAFISSQFDYFIFSEFIVISLALAGQFYAIRQFRRRRASSLPTSTPVTGQT